MSHRTVGELVGGPVDGGRICLNPNDLPDGLLIENGALCRTWWYERRAVDGQAVPPVRIGGEWVFFFDLSELPTRNQLENDYDAENPD